jgi:hypothetical protein
MNGILDIGLLSVLPSIVIPAEAGIQLDGDEALRLSSDARSWTPTFVGVTKGKMAGRWKEMAGSSPAMTLSSFVMRGLDPRICSRQEIAQSCWTPTFVGGDEE